MTNRRMYELIENAPKTGKGPTIWAWPQLTEYLKTAAQPVAGPWPPHQEPRPDPTDEDLPVAVDVLLGGQIKHRDVVPDHDQTVDFTASSP